LAAIDPENGRQIADVKLDAHPESFQLEKKGKRIFVLACDDRRAFYAQSGGVSAGINVA
jgi:hypothetical protein